MKNLAYTLCVVGTALALSACATSSNEGTYDSGASYATDRTAGEAVANEAVETRVFRSAQTK